MNLSEGPTAGRIIRFVVPWVLFVVVLMAVMNIFGQFRAAQTQAERAVSSDVTVSPGPAAGSKNATDSAVATAPPAAKTTPTVVVLLDGVNFRESARNGSAVIEALSQNATLTWIATEGNWYKARDSKGRVGYISANPTLTQKR